MPPTPSSPKATVPPIATAIAGLGRAGWTMHCEELKGKEHLFRIVAACDLLPKRLSAAKERYGCKTYRRIEDLVSDPSIELISIATRSLDHCAHACLALDAGKDVFLEKPICINYDEAKLLKKKAEKSRGRLFIRHNRRFEPAFMHVKEIIESGLLGEIAEIRLTRLGYSRRNDWQTLKQFGGGMMLNWGPHIVDHALQLLGAPVASVWSDLKRMATMGDAEDHLKVILRGRNGRVVEVHVSGGALELNMPVYAVWGTKGALTASEQTISLKYLDPKHKLPKRRASGADPNFTWSSPDDLKWIEKSIPVAPRKLYDIWEVLHKAIRGGIPFPITLEQSVEVMRVISLAKKGTGF